jgi:NADH dehydrogenase FAD-containing subunit
LSSWAGFNLSRQLNPKKFQVVVVSPRSYFVFTPLLASTAVGTLEFRTTLESVRKRSSGVEFFQGWADDVNFAKKKLFVEESAIQRNENLALTADPGTGDVANSELSAVKGAKKGKVFEMGYDKLVVAVGCYSQTFGTKGVRENALFLKDVGDARKIRKRILDCKYFF